METLPIVTPRQAGIYVRRTREGQGLTRAQLAAAAGVSERLLASLELGDATGIRLDKLLAVFGALGICLAAQGENIGRRQADDKGPTKTIPRPKTTTIGLARPTTKKPKYRTQAWSADGVHEPGLSFAYQNLLADIAQDQGIELATESTPPFIGIAR